MKKLLACIAISSGLAVAGRADQLILNVSGAPDIGPSHAFSLGFEFQVTTPVVVDGLAAFSTDPSVLNTTDDVGLWIDGGPLIASTTIVAGTPDLNGTPFAVGAITPILLAPGFYDVASNGSYAFTFDGSGFSTAPGINFVEDRYVYGASLAYPSFSEYGSGSSFRGFPGGDVVIGGTVSAPDTASTAGLLALALVAGLAVTVRRSSSLV